MARSARRPERQPVRRSAWRQGAVALGGAVSRNPVLVGGTTAFLVALSFVSANALWYQPHFHSDAFFATRSADGYVQPRFEDGMPGLDEEDTGETTIHIEREPAHAAVPKPDAAVEEVQGILRDLKFYDGPVDGIAGPNTRSAIARYRQTVGLPQSDQIDDDLLAQLGTPPTTAAIEPAPVPVPREEVTIEQEIAAADPKRPDRLIVKIQAGLKAFGNDGIEVDGVIGSKTQAAIREFQSLFGLPVTGEPDEVLYAKMREIGLTN